MDQKARQVKEATLKSLHVRSWRVLHRYGSGFQVELGSNQVHFLSSVSNLSIRRTQYLLLTFQMFMSCQHFHQRVIPPLNDSDSF